MTIFKRLFLLLALCLFLLSCKEEVVYTNRQLIDEVNNYRKDNKMSVIPISPSLNKVAQIHIDDLIAFHVPNEGCNLHSWSKHGKWSACCYDNSHSSSKCMWDKPRELTKYKGDGYEIAVFHSEGMNPERALLLWKASPGHNNMILNRDKWKKVKWKAIGAAIKGDYALVWFGRETDTKVKTKVNGKSH